MNDILQLDYQRIMTKLKPLAEAQLTSETMIHDDYDDKTKQFLKFIVDVISLSKTIESESINNLSKKLSDLIKDSNKLLVDFFTNNSLSDYYDNVLSSILKEILASLDKTKKSLTIESIKTSIKELLQTLYNLIIEEQNKVFKESYEAFQSEFKESFKEEFQNQSSQFTKQVNEFVKQEIENQKPLISKEISESVNKLLYKSVPLYLKALNKTFNDKFVKYVEKNFSAKSKQMAVASKLKRTYNAVMTPFVFASKTTKAVKDGVFSVGTKIKTKITNKIITPIRTIVDNIKTNISKKLENVKQSFLKKTEFIRKPITAFKNFKLKIKDKLDSSGTSEIFKKYGIFGVMAKIFLNAIRKKGKKFQILSQMNFKPFKFKSVLSNTIDEFIESITEHTGIVYGNLKLYFENNVVEGYNVRKRKGILTSEVGKKKEEEEEDDGFSWLDFLMMLPALFKIIKRIWKLLKKIGKFLWKAAKFIFRVGRSLVKGIARVLGRALEKLGIKFGSKALTHAGGAVARWGATKGTKGIATAAKATRTTVQTAKAGRTVFKAGKAAKAGRDAYRTLRAAGAGVKAARMGANAASMATRVSPWGVILSFGMDAAFSAYEAQDDEYMHAIFGDDVEITAQQRTSYIIAGTLLGNRSLLDADWSNPADLSMVAMETAATAAKWAGAGALIGQCLIPIPGLGALIGGAIGAVAGLAFSLIGTERLAKAINWVCDAGKAIGRGFAYVFGGEMFKDIGEGLANFGKWVGRKFENAWNATKKWCQGVADGVAKISAGIQDAFASVADSVLSIGLDIGKSLLSIGSSLLSSIFPLSPVGMVGKAIKAVANKLKNFFFGDDEKDKKIQELQKKIQTIDQVNNTSYVKAIKNKLEQHIIITQDVKEESDISEEAVTDIADIMTLTEMMKKILNTKSEPEKVPVPVEENDEDTLATVAAKHWDNPEPATT